jgi:protein TonB
MSAHLKPTMAPSGTSVGTYGTGNSRDGALYQEVPIRTLGSRVIQDPHGEMLKGESFEEESSTMLLFPQGAVIRLAAPVARGQDLMLINKRTNRYVHCRVTNLRTSPEVKSYVEVEFTHTTSNFWGVSFPKEAGKVTAIRAEMSFGPAVDPRIEATRAVLAKALAAAAAEAPSMAAAASPAPALEKPAPVSPRPPAPLPEVEEPAAPPPLFFLPKPTEAVPLCEPVAMDTEAAARPSERTAEPEQPATPLCVAGGDQAQAPAASSPLMNWEAISVHEPRRDRVRLAAASATAVWALLLLSYRIYCAVEPSFASSPQAASLSVVDAPLPLPSVAPAQPPLASAQEDASIVRAEAPEITPRETPRQLIVFVSKMTMPAPKAASDLHEAPEVTVTASDDPAAATPPPGAEAPGKAIGLLPTKGPEPPAPAEPQPTTENAAKAGDALVPARLVTSVPPVYPLLAKQAHIEGNVTIEAQIDASGNVIATRVLSGPQMLREAATTALTKWKFEPARLRDKPAPSATTVTIRFQLK